MSVKLRPTSYSLEVNKGDCNVDIQPWSEDVEFIEISEHEDGPLIVVTSKVSIDEFLSALKIAMYAVAGVSE